MIRPVQAGWYLRVSQQTDPLCCGSSIHRRNHLLVRFWHSLNPVWQAMRMAFSWLYLPGKPSRIHLRAGESGKHRPLMAQM